MFHTAPTPGTITQLTLPRLWYSHYGQRANSGRCRDNATGLWCVRPHRKDARPSAALPPAGTLRSLRQESGSRPWARGGGRTVCAPPRLSRERVNTLLNAIAVKPRAFSGYQFHFLLCESSYISPPQMR